MEPDNVFLFLMLNKPMHPPFFWQWAAILFGEWAIWVVPCALLVGWCRGGPFTRTCMVQACAAAFLALLVNLLIGSLWLHPRPFQIGLGLQRIAHVADSSFPSDHLTLLWSVAFSFLPYRRQEPRIYSAGVVLAMLGIPMAWARIYLGVHYPLDMAGALIVSLVSAWVAHRHGSELVDRTHRLVQPLYRDICRPLIRRGWFTW